MTSPPTVHSFSSGVCPQPTLWASAAMHSKGKGLFLSLNGTLRVFWLTAGDVAARTPILCDVGEFYLWEARRRCALSGLLRTGCTAVFQNAVVCLGMPPCQQLSNVRSHSQAQSVPEFGEMLFISAQYISIEVIESWVQILPLSLLGCGLWVSF